MKWTLLIPLFRDAKILSDTIEDIWTPPIDLILTPVSAFHTASKPIIYRNYLPFEYPETIIISLMSSDVTFWISIISWTNNSYKTFHVPTCITKISALSRPTTKYFFPIAIATGVPYSDRLGSVYYWRVDMSYNVFLFWLVWQSLKIISFEVWAFSTWSHNSS